MSHLKPLRAVILTLTVLALSDPVPDADAFGEKAPAPVSGRPVTLEGILPADVLARLGLLHHELEAIRLEMGKPKESKQLAIAMNAAPHEVYFQAVTLFLKANRLALELTGSTGVQPDFVSPLEVRPYHVWQLVNAAYGRILAVKEELGLTQSFSEPAKDPATTPNAVGYAIVHTNRQINRMLERRFSASDVFQQVTVAIKYAATLFRQFPGAAPMPAPPPLERGKQPADVFFRLAECYQRLEMIAQHSQLRIVQLDTSRARRADIRPSDVYDMATLLVSDLAYLHAHLKHVDPPAIVPYPGRKFPSHAYQQAGLLHVQLRELERQVSAQPAWLTQ